MAPKEQGLANQKVEEPRSIVEPYVSDHGSLREGSPSPEITVAGADTHTYEASPSHSITNDSDHSDDWEDWEDWKNSNHSDDWEDLDHSDHSDHSDDWEDWEGSNHSDDSDDWEDLDHSDHSDHSDDWEDWEDWNHSDHSDYSDYSDYSDCWWEDYCSNQRSAPRVFKELELSMERAYSGVQLLLNFDSLTGGSYVITMKCSNVDDSFHFENNGAAVLTTRLYIPQSFTCTSEGISKNTARNLDSPESSDLGLQRLTISKRDQPEWEQDEEEPEAKRQKKH
ncbi:hypothetical protein MMC22_005160 [Lobaria immixta]|nr:hypothetical protein [Lobaria immixta]